MGGLWDTIWNAIQDENTREIIAWLVNNAFAVFSVLATLAAGAWALFLFRTKAKNTPAAPAAQATASNGSVTIGGDVNAPITITTPPEQLAPLIAAATAPLAHLNAQQQATIGDLERKLGVSEGAMRTFLRTLGEEAVPLEKWPEKLAEIAERYRLALSQAAPAPGDAPAIARLKEQARAALEAGDLEGADRRLAELLAAQDAAAEAQRLDAAATLAQRGQIALTRLRYPEAAGHFASAAGRVPPGHAERLQYLDAEAQALIRQGEEKGDNDALKAAIGRYQELLKLRPREKFPLQWAAMQNNLGAALKVLGEREIGAEHLEEAADAFQASLRTREAGSFDWAMTHINLGSVLYRLGEREIGADRLYEAIAAYHRALTVCTRKSAPTVWASIQMGLGAVLTCLGERESGTMSLQEAVAAYRAALEEIDRQREPFKWALTQNNLGIALSSLGTKEWPSEWLEKGIEAFRAALTVYTRNLVPLRWAMAQHNLGTSLSRLAALNGNKEQFEEAITTFREALEERTRARVPLDWAATQSHLGNTLRALGQRTRDPAKLRQARDAIRGAFEVYMQAGHEHRRAEFECRLAEIEQALAALAPPTPKTGRGP